MFSPKLCLGSLVIGLKSLLLILNDDFFKKNYLTPKERKHLEKLDELVLNASLEDLKKIQEIDYQTQLEGLSFYDVYVDSSSLVSRSISNSFK